MPFLFQKIKINKFIGIIFIIFSLVLVILNLKPDFVSYRSEEVIRANVDPGEVLLSAGEFVEQVFFSQEMRIDGVEVFGRVEPDKNRKFLVQIYDDNGSELARSQKFSLRFFEDRTVLRFVINDVSLQKNKKYFLKVTQISGPYIHLLARGETNKDSYLMLNGREAKKSLAFSLKIKSPENSSVKQGVIAGVIIFIVALLIEFLRIKKKYLLAGICVSVLLPLGMLGFWFTQGDYGIADWDMVAPVLQGYRDTILTHHQFPLWNPVSCGGSVALADPEFSVLSVPFLMVLLLGVINGLKAGILFSVLLLSAGTFLLSKRIGLSPLGAFLSSLITVSGSAYVLHLTEGHIYICFAFSWFPWLIYAWLSVYDGKWSRLWPALVLVAQFFQGGVYVLGFSLVALCGLIIFSKNRKKAFFITLHSGLIFLGLSAFKLFPLLFWIKEHRDTVYAQSQQTFNYLKEIFLGKYAGSESVIFNQGLGWHEYGAFVGLVVLFLAILPLYKIKKDRVLRIILISLITVTIIAASGSLIKPLTDKINFLPRSDISRYILLSTFFLSILAGKGLDVLRRITGLRFVQAILVGIIAIDLFTLSYPLSEKAFALSSNDIKNLSPALYPISYSSESSKKVLDGIEYNRRYAYTQKGYGFILDCPSLVPTIGAVSDGNEKQIPFVQSVEPMKYSFSSWSPNRFSITYENDKTNIVYFNQNFASGWFVNGQPALKYKDRIAYELKPGKGKLEIKYRPQGLLLGVLVSLTSVLVLIGVSILKKRTKSVE